MPTRSQEEKERRRLLREQRKEAREKEKEGKKKPVAQEVETKAVTGPKNVVQHSPLLHLPDDAMRQILCCLPSQDLGAITLSCLSINRMLKEVRVPYILSRLNRANRPLKGAVGYIDMCHDQAQARTLLEQSFGGGETGRLITRKCKQSGDADEFVAYARYLEESVCGYAPMVSHRILLCHKQNSVPIVSFPMSPQGVRRKNPELLPPHVNGRFASVSPEHSLCRVGGDGEQCGAGGSGVAAWGVGKRGQLGSGKRQDERLPLRLLGGLGYGIRIVQVSAGGGLVRVAHSLLLTSTGRVLSFGSGQYGALGHGFSAGKQLPDVLRPQYVEGLSNVRCICVSAGELHSAAVSTDGDLYTWGDGFCGQTGHGDKRPQLVPKQVTHGGLDDECVASVSCGARHTLCVTEDGEVFSFGLGHFGVLGRSFTPFDYDADAAVVALGGEDGLMDDAPPPPAVEVRPPGEPTGIAADVLAHIDRMANLTLEDSSNQCIPMVIDSLKGITIVGASAGHRHSMLLDDMGGLYTFGTGSTGALGHGDHLSQSYPMKVMEFGQSPIFFFGVTQTNSDGKCRAHNSILLLFQ